MSERADQLANVLLEDDNDEHIKAHDVITKWDNAHKFYLKLIGLEHKRYKLYKEMGEAIGLDRALAHMGHADGNARGRWCDAAR